MKFIHFLSLGSLLVLCVVPSFVFAQVHSLCNHDHQEHTRNLTSESMIDEVLAAKKASDFLTSSPNILVVLIDFEDEPADVSSETMDAFLNDWTIESHPEAGGLKDYLVKNSHGAFTPQFDVTGWHRAKHSYSHYRNVIGSRPAADSLFRDAVTAAHQDPNIDLSDYDFNQNQLVDGMIVLTSRSIRAQAFFRDYEYAGIERWHYCFSSVRQADMNLGTTAHEFGHVLGLPDLYLTDEPIGLHCIMSHAKDLIPGNFCAWSKVQLGWVEPTLIEEPVTNFEIPSAQAHPFAVRLENDRFKDGQYFLIENRVSSDYDQSSLEGGTNPGEGILIYHVDDSKGNEWVRVMQADGKDDLATWDLSQGQEGNVGDPGDFFPGSTDNRTFGFTTNPSTISFQGNDEGVRISNISDAGPVMFADIQPQTSKGATLRINPELINIFDNSISYVPAFRGIENDTVWSGDFYTTDQFDQLVGISFYYSDVVIFPDDKDNLTFTVNIYKDLDQQTNEPNDLLYSHQSTVELPEINFPGERVFLRTKGVVWLDIPIDLPDRFFAAYCLSNKGESAVPAKLPVGLIDDDDVLPTSHQTYYATGTDFPTFDSRVGAYHSLHFYVQNEEVTPTRNQKLPSFEIAPNPASSEVKILGNLQFTDIQIFNQHGQLLRSIKDPRTQSAINLQDLSPGTYILRLEDEDRRSAAKKLLVVPRH